MTAQTAQKTDPNITKLQEILKANTSPGEANKSVEALNEVKGKNDAATQEKRAKREAKAAKSFHSSMTGGAGQKIVQSRSIPWVIAGAAWIGLTPAFLWSNGRATLDALWNGASLRQANEDLEAQNEILQTENTELRRDLEKTNEALVEAEDKPAPAPYDADRDIILRPSDVLTIPVETLANMDPGERVRILRTAYTNATSPNQPDSPMALHVDLGASDGRRIVIPDAKALDDETIMAIAAMATIPQTDLDSSYGDENIETILYFYHKVTGSDNTRQLVISEDTTPGDREGRTPIATYDLD